MDFIHTDTYTNIDFNNIKNYMKERNFMYKFGI